MPSKFFGSRDDELPEELRGLSQQEIAQAVKDSKALKAELEEARKSHGELSSKFETFSGDFDRKLTEAKEELKASFQPQRKEPERTSEAADFLTDPDRAFAERAAPLAGLVLQQASYNAKEQARKKMQRKQQQEQGKNFDGYFFDKFENEVDTLARTVPAAQLGNPETWEHIYYNVKGRHAEEIAAQYKESGSFDIESASAGSRRREDNKQDDKLTDQEINIAKKLGQTPEQYATQKKKMVGGLGVNL